MESIFNFTLKELEDYVIFKGYKKYSATNIYKWIYKRLVLDFSLMTDISKELRNDLKENFSLDLPKIVKKEESADKTVKYLFEFSDKSLVEGVLMFHNYGISYCISSQVGCNMGCKFCASGLKKKSRNLYAFELVSMMLKASIDSNKTIHHVVIMGTGEPLDNMDEVLKYIHIINEGVGLEIGIRHITLSTSGIVPKIYELADKGLGINLALSLHAPNNKLREEIMPINKAYKIEEVIEALKYYFNKTKRRITFEYLLLRGVNDNSKCAKELVELIKGLNAYINLIPYNHVDEFDYMESKREDVNKFYDYLKKEGVNVTLRHKMGDDISAACGQLRSKVEGDI